MGKLDGSESVLCVPAVQVPPALSRSRGFIPISAVNPLTLRHLVKQAVFLPRTEELERTDSFRQLIPYGVLRCAGAVFVYQRTKEGGEGRLHSRASIGIGGHLNPEDAPGTPGPESLQRCLVREVCEEVGLDSPAVANPIGFLLEDSDVGRVHLGIVYTIDLLSRTLLPGPEVLPLGWFPESDLADLELSWETWSKLVIDHLCSPIPTGPAGVAVNPGHDSLIG